MRRIKDNWVVLSTGVAWAMILSIAAIIMSIIAIVKCAPQTNLTVDYIGVIVGILTLLVTALVGWQIFVLIDLRNIQSTIDTYRRDTNRNINLHIAEMHNDFIIMHGFNGQTFLRTCSVLRRIVALSRAGDFDRIDDEINVLIAVAPDMEVQRNMYEALETILEQIENTDKIKRIVDLRRFIRDHFRLTT